MSITRPQNIEFVDWSDQVALDLAQYGVILKVHSESEWQAWGTELLRLPKISRFNPPDPYGFSEWRNWADLLCKAIIL